MTLTAPLAAIWNRFAAPAARVPRGELLYLRLNLPRLARRRLLEAVRLQLGQHLAGAFGFACRQPADGTVLVWAWPLAGTQVQRHRRPEPLFDPLPAAGLRLMRRAPGFEAQHWAQGELAHSRWFAEAPDDAVWGGFVRGCGLDPAAHPRPAALAVAPLPAPAQAWLAGDSLPRPDPWRGWRWQLAVLVVGSVVALALGAHLQTRAQLREDTQRLQTLRAAHEAALQARARYDVVAAEVARLREVVPKVSQLELLDRVVASGALAPGAGRQAAASGAAEVPGKAAAPGTAALPGMTASPGVAAGPGMAAAPGAAAASAAADAPRLVAWDYRTGLLRLTLQVPEQGTSYLDLTRRLERVAGLDALRVGQESTGNTLTISAAVPAAVDAPAADAAPPPRER